MNQKNHFQDDIGIIIFVNVLLQNSHRFNKTKGSLSRNQFLEHLSPVQFNNKQK